MIKIKSLIKHKILLFIFLFLPLTFAQSVQKIADIGNLILMSGDTINNCSIGYRTFGKINSDTSNIIIYPTWFGGTSENIGTLLSKYRFIDTTRYFVIAVDALGNGISTSPSNYNDDTVFDSLTIKDMVNSQHKLLTENFKLKNVFAVIGGSMGSMQALEWATSYPDFMKKIVAYVSSPKVSSFDLLWINTQLNTFETGRRNGMTDQEIKKSLDMMTAVISRSPAYYIEKYDEVEMNKYLESFDKAPPKDFSLDNYICQLKAIMHHDISIPFNKSMEAAAKAIKAELFIIVSENDMMVNPIKAINLAELTEARLMILQNNCGHLAVSCEIEKCRQEIDNFLQD
jgi:homoserine O-acetyltransferase